MNPFLLDPIGTLQLPYCSSRQRHSSQAHQSLWYLVKCTSRYTQGHYKDHWHAAHRKFIVSFFLGGCYLFLLTMKQNRRCSRRFWFKKRHSGRSSHLWHSTNHQYSQLCLLFGTAGAEPAWHSWNGPSVYRWIDSFASGTGHRVVLAWYLDLS